MQFSILSRHLEKLESTASRNELTILLSDLFKQCTSEEIDIVVYLLLGHLDAPYKGVVFNIAERLQLTIIAKAYGKEVEEVMRMYKQKGDVGIVAESYAKSQISPLRQGYEGQAKLKTQSVSEIHKILLEIANDEGDGSVERKVEKMSELLSSVDPISARYLARIPVGNLRLGFSDKTIIDALSWMETESKEKAKAILKAYEVVPDVGALAKKIKEVGIDKATKNITPILGIPVMPMLCQRIKSPAEMIKKMGEVSVEPKFDGLRAIIHYSKPRNVLSVFTRNLKDISVMFPELTEIAKHIKATEIILDTEAVGMDEDMLKMADFQTTMQRRRKHDIADTQGKIPVTFQVFDILYVNGKSLMDEPYKHRREILEKTVKNGNLLKVDDSVVTSDPSVITKLHKEFRSKGLEGIIVKKLDSTYIPGRTGWNWVKMKEDEDSTGKLPDTIDAVIMGFTAGLGKRTSFGIGQFLAGVKDGDKYKTITKVGTGLTDDQFRELAKRLKPLAISNKPEAYEVHKDLTPDFWVKPEVVVELAADDLTVSPKHTAGYAMRFPRLVKFRDDKDAKGATTLVEVENLFKLQ
jgi:DNA ligase 1